MKTKMEILPWKLTEIKQDELHKFTSLLKQNKQDKKQNKTRSEIKINSSSKEVKLKLNNKKTNKNGKKMINDSNLN